MNVDELVSIEQVKQFLSGTQAVAFAVESGPKASYPWIQSKLASFAYLRLKKSEKWVLVRTRSRGWHFS